MARRQQNNSNAVSSLVLEKSIIVRIPAIEMTMIFSPENLVVSHEYGIVSFDKDGRIMSSTIPPKESCELRDVGLSYIPQNIADSVEAHLVRMEKEELRTKIANLSAELAKLRRQVR